MKIQSMKNLIAEMRAVARGEKKAPKDAAMPSFESAESLLRLLTPENRDLMKIIRDKKPKSVAELARLTKRAQPNVSRTLSKLEAYGLVEFRNIENCKVPVTTVHKLQVEIDLYKMTDRIAVF